MDPSTSGAEARYDEFLARAMRGEPLDDSALGDDAGWLRALHELARSASPRRELPAREMLESEPGLPWARLGGYRLVRRLGEGGMGVVYLAEQEELGRLVALKVLRPELTLSPTALERFTREARAIARLQHPGIVGVHAYGDDQGVRYFTMDLLPGENLDERIDRSVRETGIALSTSSVLTLGVQIADALDAAHRAGIVHRDVKPQNIRVLPDGRAVLLDFGLARDANSGDPTITREFAGSPAYAAPEQISVRPGVRIDARVDVYALGATLYHALSGEPCFRGETVESLLHSVLTTDPLPIRRLRADCPADLEIVLAHALEKEPARRYATAALFAADLRAVLEFQPISARRSGAWTLLRKRMRRHPRLAAVTILAIVIPLVISAIAWFARYQARQDAGRRVREAVEQLADIESKRAARDATAFHLADLERLHRERDWSVSERARATRLMAEVNEYDARRARVLTQTQEHLAFARSVDPRLPGLNDAWANWHFLRWFELRGTSERGLVEYFRQQVLTHDTDGIWAKRLEGHGVLTLETTPPSAEVQLFQFAQLSDVDPTQSPRVVPMRALGDAEVGVPGTAAFRVISDVGAWRVGDLILASTSEFPKVPSVGVRVRAWRDGRFEEVTWDGLAPVRPTLAPRFLSTQRRVGITPLVDRSLRPAWFVAVLRAPGREPLILPFHVDHAEEHFAECAALRVELLPIGTTPDGFVRIAAEAYSWNEEGCFIAEHEVTCREYRQFLADTKSVQWLPKSSRWVSRADRQGEEVFEFVGDEAALEEPVHGVSWNAAKAYVAWRTAKFPSPLEGYRYDLPTLDQWTRAAKGGDGRSYVFGNEFRIEWALGSHRGFEHPPRVMNNALDESPFGVYDLTASVAEWCDCDPSAKDGAAPVCGGSWRDRTAAAFLIGRRLVAIDASEEAIGFRLALRREGGSSGR